MQKTKIKKLQTIRKQKLVKTIKSLAIILKIFIFLSTSIYTNSANIILIEKIGSIRPYLKIVRICYYAMLLKEGKKKRKHTTRKEQQAKRTRKTEKIEKSLKILKKCNVINFKTIRGKLNASGNIIFSILIHKLMGPISFLLLPK